MVLYEATPGTEWKDYTEKHKDIREDLEENINNFLKGEPQNMQALIGPYGQGKTQLLYRLFKYTWLNDGTAFFTKLEDILPKERKRGSKKYRDYLLNLIETSVNNLKNGDVENTPLLNDKCKDWLQEKIKNNKIDIEEFTERSILLVDEMEQNYKSLLNKVETDDNSPLKDCTAHRNFLLISAFAPTSEYEAMVGGAENRRWEPHNIPLVSSEKLRERNPELGNFSWWASKGRIGLSFKILDILENKNRFSYTDLDDFVNKEVGKIANVPPIDLDKLAEYAFEGDMDLSEYIINLKPYDTPNHTKTKKKLMKGKIIPKKDFLSTSKTALESNGWTKRETSYFIDKYLKKIIDALSYDEKFVLPDPKLDKSLERIFTLFKIAMDFAIEIEGRDESIENISKKIEELENKKIDVFHNSILPKINTSNTDTKYTIPYELLPDLFPLPITSPLIGNKSIRKSKEYLLTNLSNENPVAKDRDQVEGGIIDFNFFINKENLNKFLKTSQIDEYITPNKALIIVVLDEEIDENKLSEQLKKVSNWIKNQNRLKIVKPPKKLSDFIISFMREYGKESSEELLRDIIKDAVDNESSVDKNLSRKLEYNLEVLERFLQYQSKGDIKLNRKKYIIETQKETISEKASGSEKFVDVIGLAFCSNEGKKTFYSFRNIIEGSEQFKGLGTGITKILKSSSLGKRGKNQPLKYHKPLRIIRRCYKENINELTPIGKLVEKGKFLKLNPNPNDEVNNIVLEGIYEYISPPSKKIEDIRADINDIISKIDQITTSREKIEKNAQLKIAKSKSERSKESLKGMNKLLEKGIEDRYLKYLICNFTETISHTFEDKILHNDQNNISEWNDYISKVEHEYNPKIKKLKDCKFVFEWLEQDRSEVIKKFENKYLEATKVLLNYQEETNFQNIDNLNWESFYEQLSETNESIDNLLQIEEKIKKAKKLAVDLNKEAGKNA